MPAKFETYVLNGITAEAVTVEVDIQMGLPAFNIVGLPDVALRESRERVRSALKNSGYEFPLKRLTVNLAPAYLHKAGPGLDLAMAAAILAESGQLQLSQDCRTVICGELALDGQVRAVRGALVFAIKARADGVALVLPNANRAEVNSVGGLNCFAIGSLADLEDLSAHRVAPAGAAGRQPLGSSGRDLSEVRGHRQAKWALEVAAAGSHNLLMRGAPGSGKTMLASRLPSILPPLTDEEALETSAIYSVMARLPGGCLVAERPFRNPHHTVSAAGLIGGGKVPAPGEVTLAHNGVLFLDELAEFNRMALEALRQPIESGKVTVARAHGTATFPARFTLIAATNPCPCGFAGDPLRPCTCSPAQLNRYQTKLSGPLLDRIDLLLDVERPTLEELSSGASGESSPDVLGRVMAARERQLYRYRDDEIGSNAEMRLRHLRRYCLLDSSSEALLDRAEQRFALGGRGYVRVLRVARTLADIAGNKRIAEADLATSLAFRELKPVEAVAA